MESKYGKDKYGKERVRINMLLNADVVEQVDSYASELGISRGQAVSVICSQFFNQQKVTKISAELVQLIQSGDLHTLIQKNQNGEFNV